MTKQSGVPDAGRTLKPSNDTERLATTLASLSQSVDSQGRRQQAGPDLGGATLAARVERAILERALRPAFIPERLLGGCAWDMLLELLHAEIEERRVIPSFLSDAAGVTPSAGRRWINVLASEGLCTRAEAKDGEAIRLSRQGSEAMRSYFAELAARAG